MTEDGQKSQDKQRQTKETDGVTEETLDGLARLLPGFSKLLRGLKRSEAFRDRLNAADAEIERRLKAASQEPEKKRRHRGNIPPNTPLNSQGAPFRAEQGASAQHQQEAIADVLDEGDYLKVVVDLPGLQEDDIAVEVREDTLVLTAQSGAQHYHTEVELPVPVRTGWESTYNNGVLQISLPKRSERREEASPHGDRGE